MPPQNAPKEDEEALRATLGALKLSDIKKRAAAAGAGEDELDEALDAVDVRAAVIELVVRLSSAAPPLLLAAPEAEDTDGAWAAQGAVLPPSMLRDQPARVARGAGRSERVGCADLVREAELRAALGHVTSLQHILCTRLSSYSCRSHVSEVGQTSWQLDLTAADLTCPRLD